MKAIFLSPNTVHLSIRMLFLKSTRIVLPPALDLKLGGFIRQRHCVGVAQFTDLQIARLSPLGWHLPGFFCISRNHPRLPRLDYRIFFWREFPGSSGPSGDPNPCRSKDRIFTACRLCQ